MIFKKKYLFWCSGTFLVFAIIFFSGLFFHSRTVVQETNIFKGVELSTLPKENPFGQYEKTCSINDFGADHEDAIKTREAFRRAFSECSPGGKVVVPSGIWKTGGITIPSEVALTLEEGANVIFSSDPNLYLPVVPTRFEGMDVINYQPLLYIPNAHNVVISGKGTFTGNGSAWWGLRKKNSIGEGFLNEEGSARMLYDMTRNNIPLEQRIFGSMERPLRPSFIQPYKSENIIIEDVRFIEGPMWTIHPTYTDNVLIRDVVVETSGPNTDGIAIDSCNGVKIHGVQISSGDDAIVIKSGLDYDGWREASPSQHVQIQDVHVLRGNGGITIGSEMSGGVEDVVVDSAIFENVGTGIRLKTLKGRGGYVRNIAFRNIEMRDVIEDAIKLDMTYSYATFKSESNEYPKIQEIVMENINVYGADRAIRIDGGEPGFSNIVLKNADFQVGKAGKINDVKGLTLENIIIHNNEDNILLDLDIRDRIYPQK